MARNSYFKFKQFTIYQDQCAMKVCTDACAFGAWVDASHSKRALDIGAGTGLLSLMVAQRFSNLQIDAVEIDHSAYQQALVNIEKSPFASQIQLWNTAIQEYSVEEPYDLIFTNPPFFQNDLKSPDQKANMAHHSDTLTFDALEQACNKLLSSSGKLAVLLPLSESVQFVNLLEGRGWHCVEAQELVHKLGMPIFRRFLVFQKEPIFSQSSSAAPLYIYERDGKTYTDDFISLLKSFYLAI